MDCSKWFHTILQNPIDKQHLLNIEPERFMDKYYTAYYVVDFNQVANNDYTIFQHSNGVCVLALAPTHFIFDRMPTFEGLVFQISRNVDLTQSVVKGKQKRGGHVFNSASDLIARCKFSDSPQEVPLHALVPGRLFEVNQSLTDQGQILQLPEHYLAIVMPKMPRKRKSNDDNEQEYANAENIKTDVGEQHTSRVIPYPKSVPELKTLTYSEYKKLRDL